MKHKKNSFDLLIDDLKALRKSRRSGNTLMRKASPNQRVLLVKKPMTPQDLLVKAEMKMRQGALTGREFQRLDVAMRHNLTIDPLLKAKILA